MSRPQYKYIELQLYNQNTNPSLSADFELSAIFDLIDDSSLYDLSIIRFSVDTTTIPLMIVPILTGQTNPNATVYTFTLQQGANIVTKRVIWTPEFIDEPTPGSPFTKQDVGGAYYYLMNVQHLIDLFNLAIQEAHDDLPVVAGRQAPFFRINPGTQQIELIAQSDYYDNMTDPPPADLTLLYCNQEASSLLQYFTPIAIRDLATTDQYFCFQINNLNSFNVFPPPVGASDIVPPASQPSIIAGSYYIMTQTKTSLACFNTLSAIQINANKGIPAQLQTTTPGVDYGVEVTTNTVTEEDDQPILTNFIVDPDVRLASSSGRLVYNPQGEFRLLSLNQAKHIRSLGFQMLWVDVYGNSRVIKLQRNTSASVLMMFKPRELMLYDAERIARDCLVQLRTFRV